MSLPSTIDMRQRCVLVVTAYYCHHECGAAWIRESVGTQSYGVMYYLRYLYSAIMWNMGFIGYGKVDVSWGLGLVECRREKYMMSYCEIPMYSL